MNNCRKRIAAGVAAIALPVFTLLLFLSRDFFIRLSALFPECQFYSRTGLLCPACGNTRSIIAFLKGDIIESAGYNVTPILLFTFAALFYIETTAYALGMNLHVIPRKYGFLAAVMTALPLYYVLRNIIPFLTLC